MDITQLDKMGRLIGFDHRLPLVGCIHLGKQVHQSKATSHITWSMGNDDAKCKWQISQVIKLAKMIKWRFRQLRVFCQLRDIVQLLFILVKFTNLISERTLRWGLYLVGTPTHPPPGNFQLQEESCFKTPSRPLQDPVKTPPRPRQDPFKSRSKSPLDAPRFECHPERHPECQDQYDMLIQ